MKRFLTLLLALVMVLATLGLTACKDEEKSLYERYTEAMKNFDEIDSVDAALSMDMKMDVMGTIIEMPVTATMKGDGLKGENPVMRVVTTMSAGGETMTEDIYTAGGWDYYTSADGNYKMPSEDDADNALALSDEILSEATIAKGTVTEKDGITTVTLDLTADEFMKAFKSFAEGLADSELTTSGLSKTKASFSFNKKNELTALSFSFKMEITSEGITMGTELDVTLTINKVGGVTVEAPAGYENYEAIDEG